MNKELIKKALQTNSLEIPLSDTSISIYTDTLTKKGILESMVNIKSAFPILEQGFYDQLSRMIKEDKFTDIRLKDAVDNVIRTCLYPQPTIAQFLSYDKRLKLYDYKDIVKMTDTNRNAFDDYRSVDINGKSKYAYKTDINNYNLKLWDTKQI